MAKICLGCGEELKLSKSEIGRPGRTAKKQYCRATCKTTNPLIRDNRRLYVIWKGMIARCDKPYDNNYHKYGAQGIGVCTRWYKFADFLTDMLPAYRDGLTLDRIDPEGDYKPSNCRWATYSEQRINQKRQVLYDGLTLAQLAEKHGLTGRQLWARLFRYGWPMERALNEKPRAY